MRQHLIGGSAALALLAVVGWAGALQLEIGNPQANTEAKDLQAVLLARVTACREPAKSTLTANAVHLEGAAVVRTPLQVRALRTPGLFAVIGAVPAGSVIDLAVTNPEYANYQPRVLLRSSTQGVQWASVKRFFSTPPTEADLQRLLQTE